MLACSDSRLVSPSFCWSVRPYYCATWAFNCAFNGLMAWSAFTNVPAHQHATWGAVYTALYQSLSNTNFSLSACSGSPFRHFEISRVSLPTPLVFRWYYRGFYKQLVRHSIFFSISIPHSLLNPFLCQKRNKKGGNGRENQTPSGGCLFPMWC